MDRKGQVTGTGKLFVMSAFRELVECRLLNSQNEHSRNIKPPGWKRAICTGDVILALWIIFLNFPGRDVNFSNLFQILATQ